MILPNYYEDPQTLHRGTLPNHAYFIPFPKEALPQGWEDRTLSGRFYSLCGQWDFRYESSVQKLDTPFWDPSCELSGYSPIPVPSCWQNMGYDHHQYTNTRIPFPYDPPYVPLENPCGAYRRDFSLEVREGRRYLLNFEGVDSCFYVWINGNFAGFSQVSHSTSEFDVTGLVRNGVNTIAVLVLKWCVGSYFEDQDKFRSSGIFRDVYLLERDENHIRDFSVQTRLSEGARQAEISVSMEFSAATAPVSYRLLDPSGRECAAGDCRDGAFSLSLEQPVLWNAETPCLYTLLLSCGDEIIPQEVGVREVAILDRVLCLNGKPIKFRGVNRHDSSPVDGAAVTLEHMRADLKLMKEHNVNAVRTSHYPNAPEFLRMCDRYGFYVIAEADIECHTVVNLYGYGNGADYSRLANDPAYGELILDRVQRSVTRDKNHSSVLIWSMGNESGFGCNFEAALAWTKQYDPTRLTHYEGSVHPYSWYKADLSNLDVYSKMYDSTQKVLEYFSNPDYDKPFIQCEYCHAMGNGPGDLEDYAQLIERFPGFAGGFIWEWCDHAVDMGRNEKGKKRYFYGGDFGEFPHDGNFCMDGLVYPDRTPHTGLLEYKNVLRPVRFEAVDLAAGRFQARNMLDFINTKDFVEVSYEITQNGYAVASGNLGSAVVDLLPHQRKEFTVPLPEGLAGDYAIRFDLTQTTDAALTKAGRHLGFEQLGRDHAVLPAPTVPEGPLSVEEPGNLVVVRGACFQYEYNKLTGAFSRMVYKNNNLLEKPMEYNIWRAPVDNDRVIRMEWEKCGYHRASSRGYETTVEQQGSEVIIRSHVGLVAVYLQRLVDVDAVWKIDASGRLTVFMDVKKCPVTPFLPRFGLRLFLADDMEQAVYFGYGPYESYIDKHRASWLGRFETTVRALHEDYIKPQENGSHWGCQLLELHNGRVGLRAWQADGFCFNASHYTQEELAQKAHNFELEESGHVVLCLDALQSGMGSNSCGPQLLEPYRVDGDFTFRLSLAPYLL